MFKIQFGCVEGTYKTHFPEHIWRKEFGIGEDDRSRGVSRALGSRDEDLMYVIAHSVRMEAS